MNELHEEAMLVQPRSFEERVTMLERQMQEIRNLPERVTSLESQILQLRHVMQDQFSAARSDLASAVTTITQAIADTNTHMRALHEDALSRIATVGEGRRPGKKR